MPNHTCCVPGCKNQYSRKKDIGVRYYKFPSDSILQCVWLMKISQERTFVVTANTRVCSEHFARNIKDENNPISTLFPWKNPKVQTPKRPLPKKRIIQEAQNPQTKKKQQQQTASTSVVRPAVTLLQEKPQ